MFCSECYLEWGECARQGSEASQVDLNTKLFVSTTLNGRQVLFHKLYHKFSKEILFILVAGSLSQDVYDMQVE